MDLLPENSPALEAHLRSLGWLAPEQQLLSLAPAGAGNMNRTLRAVTPARTFILKQAVPFVARHPDIPAPINRLLCMTDPGPGPDFLSLYDAEPESVVRTGNNGGQLTAVVYWLWKLHALPLEQIVKQVYATAVLENRAMRELNHAHIFDIPLQVDNGVDVSSALRKVQQAHAQDTELKERARALGAIYLGEADHASAPALLHGDYYPGSWLKHKTMGVMIIDPEFAFPGPPELDVGVLIAHLTMAGFEQPEIMMLLRSYVTPPRFSYPLALASAGMEIIRRLLGVAQLPRTADDESTSRWLQTARSMVMT